LPTPEKVKNNASRHRSGFRKPAGGSCPEAPFFGPILAVASARVLSSLKNRPLFDMPFLDLLICAPSFALKIDSAARRTIELGVSARLLRQVEMES